MRELRKRSRDQSRVVENNNLDRQIVHARGPHLAHTGIGSEVRILCGNLVEDIHRVANYRALKRMITVCAEENQCNAMRVLMIR